MSCLAEVVIIDMNSILQNYEAEVDIESSVGGFHVNPDHTVY